MSQSPNLCAAVVGTGFIAPVHVEALRRLGRVVAGVVGSSPERARQAAARWGLARAYGSLEEMLADPAVGVVHVTSPNRHHHGQCKKALAAGKHVVCEKPVVGSLADIDRLIAAEAESAARLMPVFQYRFGNGLRR